VQGDSELGIKGYGGGNLGEGKLWSNSRISADLQSVRGCIVANDIRVLACIIVKQGENDMPGLTDTVLPKRLGPKRGTSNL
jgi:hypothetical protein